MAFIKKHKKLIIILSVILIFFIMLITLMFTLFSLKKVEIQLETESKLITEEVRLQIIDEIDLGGTVFFKDKEVIVNKIENNYPYAKVINIETKIPNKFVIHLAERQEVYAISIANKHCVLDADLKILKVVEEGFVSTSLNPIDLNLFGLEFDFSDFKEGKFLNLESLSIENFTEIGQKLEGTLKKLINCFQVYNKNLVDIKALIKSLRFATYTDYRTGEVSLSANLTDFNNFSIAILNPSENLEDKISKMLYVYEDILTTDLSKLNTHKLTVLTNSKGENIAVLEEKS